MSKWICEDVGLFINELRDRLSEKLDELTEKDGEDRNPDNDEVIRGVNIAYDILDELADEWTSNEPSEDVLNKIKRHYGEMDFE